MMIKEWFLRKNFNQNEAYIINLAMISGEIGVVAETDKAYKLKAHSDFGTISFWVPKSCTISDEEAKKEMELQMDKFNKGMEYNEKLVEFAKQNGIKGIRKGMKTSTLLSKINQAGLIAPQRA